MANLKSLIIFFCIQAPFIMVSIPATESRTLMPNDENLIENTCKRTPNYNVCLQSLKAYPESSSADVKGLAEIMVKVLTGKANDGLKKIHELQRLGQGSRQALSSCADKYTAILTGDIPQATEALQKGNPKFAESGANDAAKEATRCDNEFSGKSLLTKENNDVHDVAAVTAAIAGLLL